MKTLLASIALILASCASYPAHADTALEDGASPAIVDAMVRAKDIPAHQDAIDKLAPTAPVRVHTDATRADATEIEKKLAVAQAKIEDAQKFEDAQAAELASLKDADDAQTKLWLRVLGSGFLLGAAVGAYLLGQGGSIIRAAGVGAAGAVVGIGCFWAAAHIQGIWLALEWTLALAALTGLVAAVLHFRKGATDKDNALWALGNAAGSAAIGGAKGVIVTADESLHTWLKATLTDKQYEEAIKYLPK